MLVSKSASCNRVKMKCEQKQQASPNVSDCFTVLSKVCSRFLDRFAQSMLPNPTLLRELVLVVDLNLMTEMRFIPKAETDL